MSFFRFVFSFLFTRNWHTGKMELSWPRVAVLLSFLFLLALAAVMISYLQTPLVYNAK